MGIRHALGPFELWDALGFPQTCERLEREGRALPENIVRMRQSGVTSFYKHDSARTQYFDLVNIGYADLEPRPGVESLRCPQASQGCCANRIPERHWSMSVTASFASSFIRR